VAGGSGTGTETVGTEVVLERGAGAGSVMREWMSGGSTVLFGASSVGGAAEREKGEERGGEGGSGRRGATRREGGCGAWPRPAGGAPTMSRSTVTRTRRARVARRCSDSGTLVLMGGPRW
jgi:hypothetical protein